MASSYRTGSQPVTQPINLILDFDGTLTMKDTMHLVAEAGYTRQKELRSIPQPRPWKEIVDAYMADFRKHSEEYTPTSTGRTAPEDEAAWLNSLQSIEKASIARAVEAGVFDKVRSTDMAKAAKAAIDKDRLHLRNGWVQLFDHVWHRNRQTCSANAVPVSLNILSVNWSTSWVAHVILASAGHDPENVPWLDNLAIHANELPSIIEDMYRSQYPSKVLSNNPLQQQAREIRTSGDKLHVLKSILSAAVFHQHNGTEPISSLSIYIGDTATDLECLMAADVGICIRDDPLGSGQKDLADTCSRLGIEVHHVHDYTVASFVEHQKQSWVLLWAKDFHEIKQCLTSGDRVDGDPP